MSPNWPETMFSILLQIFTDHKTIHGGREVEKLGECGNLGVWNQKVTRLDPQF